MIGTESFLGSLFNHYAEQQQQQQQLAQVPAGLQQQILQIASMPTLQTAHVPTVVSTPVPIQPKPSQKPIAPATMNPAFIPHKQSFQSKVNLIFHSFLFSRFMGYFSGECQCISCPEC